MVRQRIRHAIASPPPQGGRGKLAAIGVLCGLALLAAGCQTAASDKAGTAQATDGGPALGANLLGEACRAAPRARNTVDVGVAPPFDVFCGAARHASGSLSASPLPSGLAKDGEARRAALAAAAQASALGQTQPARMACRPGTWTTGESGADVLIAACTLKQGNWPYLTLATAIGDQLVVGEGIPAIAPVLERGAELLWARGETAAPAPAPSAPKSPQDTAAEIARLEAALGGKAALFGTADIDRYRSLMELARLYDSVQNFSGSERAYLQALEVQSRVLPADNPGIGETLIDLALEVSNQGRAEDAEALFRRAEPLLQRNVDPAVQARYTSYRAFAAANQGKFDQALALARDATAQRRTIASYGAGAIGAGAEIMGRSSDASVFGSGRAIRAEVAQSLYLQAAMALRRNDLGSARAAINEALDTLNEVPGLPLWWRPQFLMVEGEVNGRVGQVADAEADFAAALQQRQRLFGDTVPTGAVHMALGRLYHAEGVYAAAIDSFRRGRATLAKPENAAAARDELAVERLMPYLDSLAELAAQNPDQRAALHAEMFEVSQLIDTGVTSDTIARAAARVASNDPAIAELVRSVEEAQRERDMAQLELANEAARSDDRRDRAVEQAIAERLRKASETASALEQKLQEAFPTFSRMTNTHAVTLADVTDRLGRDEAIVSFVFGKAQSFGFAVAGGKVTAAKLEITSEQLDDMVGELRRAFVAHGGQPAPFDLALAHALYRETLGPLEPALAGVTHLVVVPNGALLSLPPGLLVTSAPARGAEHDYRNAAWLARRIATSVAPSVDGFLRLRALKGRPSAPKPFIGFGNPGFTGKAADAANSLAALNQACRTGAGLPPALLRALAPLPETADEVRRVAATLRAGPDSVILGKDVNEATLHKLPLDQYRVVYFATHGLLPGELRCQSEPGLALSPPDHEPSGVDDDGLLGASEVASLRLDADLVVLSACNTGGGAGRFGGQALSGLAEAFFYAGSRALVVSHWQVPSVPTAALMTGMFERLGPDLKRGGADALRQTQLKLAAAPETAHPFYWAAFTLVGDGGAAGERAAAAPASPTPSSLSRRPS